MLAYVEKNVLIASDGFIVQKFKIREMQKLIQPNPCLRLVLLYFKIKNRNELPITDKTWI